MKLKQGFIMHTVDNQTMLIASGEVAKEFNGIVRTNGSAAYIIELLKSEITEEEIVNAMCVRYDANKEQIKKDVHNLIVQLRNEGFLDE